MAATTKYTCRGLMWSFLFGFSSGVGGMIWLLLKLLRFQRSEIERSYAWLLWQHKHARSKQAVAGKPLDTITRTPSVEELDGEWKVLLQHVDEYLSEDSLPTMSTREREVAMAAFYEHRHEGKFQYALHEAVKEVIRFRRTESGSHINICGVVHKAANS